MRVHLTSKAPKVAFLKPCSLRNLHNHTSHGTISVYTAFVTIEESVPPTSLISQPWYKFQHKHLHWSDNWEKNELSARLLFVVLRMPQWAHLVFSELFGLGLQKRGSYISGRSAKHATIETAPLKSVRNCLRLAPANWWIYPAQRSIASWPRDIENYMQLAQ